LNAIKLDLALAVTVCVLAALLIVIMPLTPWKEVVTLALVALTAAAWVVLRTRRVLQKARQESWRGEGRNEQTNGVSMMTDKEAD